MSRNDLVSVRHLLEQALNDPDEEQWFGEYRIVRLLGRGGMGAVFEAEASHLDRVALKRLLEPDLASESEERRFLFGAEAQSRLNHKHIVKVRHVGKCRGRAYFTMDLVTGGNLRDWLDARSDQTAKNGTPRYGRADFALLAKVTDAVAHAHAHGLLHRDLKPENILLDADGEPQIADFGLAKEVDSAWTLTEPGSIGGTTAYMSPEQAAGKEAMRFSDIYSLGAILYELITGRRQFDDATGLSRQRIASDEAVRPPCSIDPSIPDEIERVCLKCLEKKPEDRYPGAAALRDDLWCLAKSKPPSLPPRRGWRRALHFIRRHSTRVRRVAQVTAGVLAVLALAGYWFLAQARAERAALETNAFIATAQAGAALFQFREFADRVEKTAALPEIQKVARATAVVEDSPVALKALAEGFDAAFVVTKAGYITTQWPTPPLDIWNKWFGFRDYFIGAARLGKRGAPGVYVGRAFRSERDREIKFGVSAPLFDGGEWVGVLVAVVHANPAFGRVRMRDENDGNRITALIGPRDIDREEAPAPPRPDHYVVLVHDGLTRGAEVRAPNSRALKDAVRAATTPDRQFSLTQHTAFTDSSYLDPVRGHAGAWHAAFAPVGGTGYVIVVQSRR